VHFLPDYNVSLAERIIPAADLSEQISTAGMEASGTGNMKLMMNGALTMGTLDGANIEIMEEVGRENIFIFGLNAEEVVARRRDYQPRECYAHDPLLKATLDLIFSGHFNPLEPGLFEPIRQALLEYGDYYMHLADLPSYTAAQRKAGLLFSDRIAWSHKAALNVACSGKFSSDRTILEYAKDIWKVKPVPIKANNSGFDTVYMARGDLDLPVQDKVK
jgi:glycogen phosphorylase